MRRRRRRAARLAVRLCRHGAAVRLCSPRSVWRQGCSASIITSLGCSLPPCCSWTRHSRRRCSWPSCAFAPVEPAAEALAAVAVKLPAASPPPAMCASESLASSCALHRSCKAPAHSQLICRQVCICIVHQAGAGSHWHRWQRWNSPDRVVPGCTSPETPCAPAGRPE